MFKIDRCMPSALSVLQRNLSPCNINLIRDVLGMWISLCINFPWLRHLKERICHAFCLQLTEQSPKEQQQGKAGGGGASWHSQNPQESVESLQNPCYLSTKLGGNDWNVDMKHTEPHASKSISMGGGVLTLECKHKLPQRKNSGYRLGSDEFYH